MWGKLRLDEELGTQLRLSAGVPSYQVEDEECRIHLLLHLPIEEENEDLWRPDQAGFDPGSIFHGALVEEQKSDCFLDFMPRPKGTCTYCGTFGPSHMDHVPPENLFETGHKSDLVTGCRRCNNGVSKEDQYFLVYLALRQDAGQKADHDRRAFQTGGQAEPRRFPSDRLAP